MCFDRVPDGDARSLDLGTLTVGPGALAYLAHPEHAYSGIGPGTYVLRRQRELDTTRPVRTVPVPRPRAVRERRTTPVRFVED